MDLTTVLQWQDRMHELAQADPAITGYSEPKKMAEPGKLSFTINEKHLRLLDEATEDIKVRFNTMVAVEETAYASTESDNIRWVEIEGRDYTQAKFAKAYIEALCSPKHQQILNYPVLLHQNIAGKTYGLEHKYNYKAVVRFQLKGTMLVSGQTDEVLMLVSYLEHDINQWRLQSRDYGEQYEQLSHEDLQSDGHSEDTDLPGIHTVSQTHLADKDSGRSPTLPDFVPRISQRTFAPHSSTRTTSPYKMGTPVALHSSQVGCLPQQLKPIDPASPATHAQPFQSQVEFSNSQFGEEDLPHEDIKFCKPVHICTPPHSCVDLKRQRTDTGQQLGTIVGHCNSIHVNSPSELNSRRLSTGSFKNSHSFEFACNAAYRRGYSKQDVEEALKELPQDWKTSELISTLSSRTHQQSSTVLFNAPCVQPHNSDSSRTLNSSLFSDEDSTGDKSLSSSQPLLLTSLSQNAAGIINREPCGKTETLRRRQQELLKCLGPQSSGRKSDIIPIAAAKSADESFISNTSSNIPAKNYALTTTKQMSVVDYNNASQGVSELPLGRMDDVICLTDVQDMDCSVALESVENMEVENKDVEYIHTTFPENTEPDVLLLSTPPKKPELVIIDDEDKQFHPQVTKSQKIRQQFSAQIPKISLAPVFNTLQQVNHLYSDNTLMSGSLSTLTSQSQYQDDLVNDSNNWNSPPHPSSPLHLGAISETKMQIKSDSKQTASYSRASVDKQHPLHTLTNEKHDLAWKNNSKDEIKTLSSVSKNLKNIPNVQNQPLLPQVNLRETVPLMKHLPLSIPEKTNSEQNNLHDIDNVENKSIDLQQIKQENTTSDSLPEVQEIGVIELLRQFREDFELKKEEFEKEVREKTVKETLDMVAEENEVIQRQNLQQKQKDDSDDKATTVTDQDVEEKLRIERKKMNEKQKKAIQKLGQQFKDFKEKVLTESEGKLQEQYAKLMQQQRDQLLQQHDELQQQQLQEQQRLVKEQQDQFHKGLQKMQKDMQKQQEQMKKQIEEHSRPMGAMAADVRAEKDVIVIMPSVKGTPSPFRPVVIDGSNIAMLHGKRNRLFSCRGIALCVQYFQNMGIKDITVFVPRWRQTQDAVRNDRQISDKQILDSLERKGILSFTPSRKVRGRYINSYDDRFIVKLATENGGIIVSNDNFRDLMQESEEWKQVIETRLLMFTFAGDKFMIPDDPYGRNGPTLVELLQRPKPDLTGRIPPGGVTQTAIRQQEPGHGLNESQLKELSYNIGMEWERLGTYLRFSHSEITKIRSNHPHNTDGAILHMLKTWNGRQRSDKTNRFGILAEALKHSGRADLAEMVLQWKRNSQQGGNKGAKKGHSETDWGLLGPVVHQQGVLGQGVDKQQGHGSEADWGQWMPVHSRQGGRREAGVRQGAYQAPDQHPQQTFGVRPKHNAPATLSTPPPVDIKTLAQYKTLIEMFPDKRDSIEKLLIENPNCEDNYLLDMLL